MKATDPASSPEHLAILTLDGWQMRIQPETGRVSAIRTNRDEQYLPTYDRHYFLNNYIHRAGQRSSDYDRIIELTRNHIAPPILDLGAGAGLFIQRLHQHGFDATGIEPSTDACQLAAKHGIELINADPLTLEHTQPARFNTIFCLDVIAHIPEPSKVLNWIHEHLAPDGKLILKTPEHGPEYYRKIASLPPALAAWRTHLAHLPFQLHGWNSETIGTELKAAHFSPIQTMIIPDFVHGSRFTLSDLIHPRRILYKL
ncbi:MAG: class I SAM-dependent methyltransferase, partial [Lentisphaerae bacterium]